MKILVLVTVLAVAVGCSGTGQAEVVFSNLNTSSSASVGSGFTQFAQRFTTVSAGTGFQVGLNLVSLTGTQIYDVELWSADGAGTNVSALLSTIGSGSVSLNDKTAVTSFSSSYALDAVTNYFIKIVASSGNFGITLGPNSATTLNSITRYGVGNLNNTAPSSAFGMQVAVVPEPTSATLAGIAAILGAGFTFRRRKPLLS